MEEIDNLSYDSLAKYFTSLSQFGYKSYEEVYKLLALIGLEEMLDVFAEFITEQDLKEIMTAINCLSGTTCLIDYPNYINDNSIIHKSKLNYLYRVSENNVIRMEGNNPRVIDRFNI